MNELLEDLAPRAHRFALRLTGDRHQAEDLAQEAVLRAWNHRDQLRAPAAARVWLFRIVHNLWRDGLRRGRSPVAKAEPLDGPVVASDRDPAETVCEQESVKMVLAVLERLPEKQRQALYLNACEGLAAAEIAEVLDTNPNAVKTHLSLARKRMREELQDLFHELFPRQPDRACTPPAID